MSFAIQSLTKTFEDDCQELIVVGQRVHDDAQFKPHDPKPVYQILRMHQETEEDWELSGTLGWLQKWTRIFNERFKLGLTKFTLGVDWLQRNRRGQFRRGFNALGLTAEVTIDRREIETGNEQEILGVLLHELLHAWQEQYGTPSNGHNNHHNAEFRRRAAECGLRVDEHGHQELIPGSPFFEVLQRAGLHVTAPPVVPKPPQKKAATKLKKWSCGCVPPVNVRVAVDRFQARCLLCNQIFQRAG